MSRPPRQPDSDEKPTWIRRLRRRARPLHPNRLRARAIYRIHRLGWFRLRPWLVALAPRRLARTWRWRRRAREEVRRRRREPRLTVAVDISALWQPLTGVGWSLYRLLEAMAERDDVRLRLYGPGLIDAGDVPSPVRELPRGPALERVRYRVPDDLSLTPAFLASFLRRRAARLIAADSNRVLFAPNYLLPADFDGVEGARVPVVHDLSAFVVPETMRESTLEELRTSLRSTLSLSRRVITDSHAVRAELVAAKLAAAEQIDVVPLAPALDPLETASAVDAGRFVLFVGTLEPRKNLAMLIEAFERYSRRAESSGEEAVELIVCGGVGWKAGALLERLEKAQRAGLVRRLGYVSEAELAAYYRGAEWLILPSLYEGFGLPAVEAMAAGVPLLLADIPVLREVGGDAALYAPPSEVDAWDDLLQRALGDADLRAELAARARARGRRFSWAETAEATVAVWRRAAEDPRT